MLKRNAHGFTLIEVMVVVVILSILAAWVVPKIFSRPDEARLSRVKGDVRAISNALELYRLDNFVYPSTDQGLEALVKEPTNEPLPRNWKADGYLERVPNDPWGTPYQYLSPGENGEYDVFSLGADGRAGGEGVNADVGNWNVDDIK